MRFLRLLPVPAVALVAVDALFAPAALADTHFFKTGNGPTCTVTSTASSSSSTTCTGTLSNKSKTLVAVTYVSGFTVFQCEAADGTTTTGQNDVAVATEAPATPIPTGGNVTFTTNPAVLTAPSTASAQAAGCPSGSTAVSSTLTTTSITLSFDNGSLLFPGCTASNPKGLSGTVALSC
jgi:hypothetical protein